MPFGHNGRPERIIKINRRCILLGTVLLATNTYCGIIVWTIDIYLMYYLYASSAIYNGHKNAQTFNSSVPQFLSSSIPQFLSCIILSLVSTFGVLYSTTASSVGIAVQTAPLKEKNNIGLITIQQQMAFDVYNRESAKTFTIIPSVDAKSITVCDESGSCNLFDIEFKNIFSHDHLLEQTSFGIVNTDGQLQVCRITDGVTYLDCGTSKLDAVFLASSIEDDLKLQKKTSNSAIQSSQCRTLDSGKINCSKVREVAGLAMVYAGSFSKPYSTEILRFGSAKPEYCEVISGHMKCQGVNGLEKIAQMTSVMSARLTKNGLSTLVGISSKRILLCTLDAKSKKASFNCQDIDSVTAGAGVSAVCLAAAGLQNIRCEWGCSRNPG